MGSKNLNFHSQFTHQNNRTSEDLFFRLFQTLIFESRMGNSPSNDCEIHRLHIGREGVIGSLYNARKDCFLDGPISSLPLTHQSAGNLSKYSKFITPQCRDQINFDLLNIDRDFNLSIKLELTPQSYLSPLINYQLSPNVLTQLVYFYRISEEIFVPDKQKVLPSDYTTVLKDIKATHFVTKIRRGIILILLFELPSEAETTHRVQNRLIIDENT